MSDPSAITVPPAIDLLADVLMSEFGLEDEAERADTLLIAKRAVNELKTWGYRVAFLEVQGEVGADGSVHILPSASASPGDTRRPGSLYRVGWEA